jgi:flagellar basal body-associated protein FliL
MEPTKKFVKIIWIIVFVVVVFIIAAVSWLYMRPNEEAGSVNSVNQPQSISPEAATSSTSQEVSGSVRSGLDSMNFDDLNSGINNLNADINKL